MAKRIFDFVFAFIILILFSPLFLSIALFIKATSPGPVFSLRTRVGKAFRPFCLYQLRVIPERRRRERRGKGNPAGAEGSVILGLLNSLKIWEFPQLINVLKGEMSLVGPRPEPPFNVRCFEKDFETILKVRPGMTDFFQINPESDSAAIGGPHRKEGASLPSVLSRRIKLAKAYVQNQSFLLDLKILFTTFVTIFLSLSFSRKDREAVSLKDVLYRRRGGIVFFIHSAAIVLAGYSAFWLRFDGHIPPAAFVLFLKALPVALLVRLAGLHAFGLNQGLWRYAGIRDLLNIGGAIGVSSAILWSAATLFLGDQYPRFIFLTDGLLLFLTLTALRSVRRVYAVLTEIDIGARRVLIVGAGDAGEMVARDMRQNPSYHRQPAAFIDDDPKKRGMKIHNIPVIGSTDEIDAAVKTACPDEILIAIPSATARQIRAIIKKCRSFNLPIKTLPMLSAILGGKVSITDIRNLDIEDLLGRPEIAIVDPDVEAKIRGKRVLVTGAGGSIGSELSRQIAALQPERLVLFERSENNLYHIELDLLRQFPDLRLEGVLGDILDGEKLEQVFSAHRPQVVFHAAAYKHVPMMEKNPLEAVQNNILGTHQVITAADRHGADEFVLISTDKAVYPTSVMGATKRAAEMLVRYFNPRSRTRLISVRFGNVLESSGSVVPLFREQIKKGGPVTVTHPKIERYFITIREAVQLVLEAAVLGEGGEVFVLDMGEPIKIAELARTMIILSGCSPEEEIPIQFTGLRPGEKMVESLFEEGERVIQTRHQKLKLAQNGEVTEEVITYMPLFAAMDYKTDPREIKAILKQLISTYSSDMALPEKAQNPI